MYFKYSEFLDLDEVGNGMIGINEIREKRRIIDTFTAENLINYERMPETNCDQYYMNKTERKLSWAEEEFRKRKSI